MKEKKKDYKTHREVVLRLKISTLKEIIKQVEEVRKSCSIDDIYSMNDDKIDVVELLLQLEHDPLYYTESAITKVETTIKCEAIHSEEINLW